MDRIDIKYSKKSISISLFNYTQLGSLPGIEPTAFWHLDPDLNHHTINIPAVELWGKKGNIWTLEDIFFIPHPRCKCPQAALLFVHSVSLTSEKFPCFPWPLWNSVCLFLHSPWQQRCGLHCKTAVCNFPKSTWEIEVIIWMNLEWWGLHVLRHVYFHCFPCLPLWPVMPGSKWDWTDPGTVGSKGPCKWWLRSACQSWSWAWNKRCWLWELHLSLQGGLVKNRFGVMRSWWCAFCGRVREAHPSSCHSSDGKANRENKPPIHSRTPKIQELSKTAALIIRQARMCVED